MIVVLIMLAILFTFNWLYIIISMIVNRCNPEGSPLLLHTILAVLYTTIGYMVLHQ